MFWFAVDRRSVSSTFLSNSLIGGQPVFFDNATRLIAGPRITPLRSKPAVYLVSRVVNFKSVHILSNTGSVEMTGFEPVAFALQRRCSPAELHPRALPENQVGLTGLEPVTPVLSGLCSNQLSYRPAQAGP